MQQQSAGWRAASRSASSPSNAQILQGRQLLVVRLFGGALMNSGSWSPSTPCRTLPSYLRPCLKQLFKSANTIALCTNAISATNYLGFILQCSEILNNVYLFVMQRPLPSPSFHFRGWMPESACLAASRSAAGQARFNFSLQKKNKRPDLIREKSPWI